MDKYLSEALWAALGKAVSDKNAKSARVILDQIDLAEADHPNTKATNEALEIPSGQRTAFLREILEKNNAFDGFRQSREFNALDFKTKQYSDWISLQSYGEELDRKFPEWRVYISNVIADYCTRESPIYKGVERLETRGHYRLINEFSSLPFFTRAIA